EAAIRELGYVPSKAARMMRSNKSGLIGLITGAISNSPEPAEPRGLPDLLIVQGIQKVIADSGKTLMIADTGGLPDRVSHLVQTFLEHRAEGLIYVADYHQQVTLPPLPGGCPLVLANCFDSTGHPAIVPDDRAGQRDIVRKLIESGHRRIGFLTLDRTMVATGLRYQGYRDALAECGILYDDQLVAMAVEIGSESDNTLL
ncbi:LacI family transcriptional regulator, partial [Lutimaribacter sp. EGI FJ00014]|nr:LacI family transcriptional regulator [Lutimaribacter sp. EGI FJ00014]